MAKKNFLEGTGEPRCRGQDKRPSAPESATPPSGVPWAVVTGASAGIGRAFCQRLATEGYQLVVAARRRERLEELVQELPVPVVVVAADLATAAGREHLWQAVRAISHPPELLVNNAGFGLKARFSALDRQQQLEMVQLNITALTDLAHRFVGLGPVPGAARRGVINVASVLGFWARPQMAVYSATKHYVVAFSRALHQETRGQGLDVLALCPGPVPTEFQKRAQNPLASWRQLLAISPEQVAEEGLWALRRGRPVWVPGRAMRWVSWGLIPAGAWSNWR